MRVAGISQVSLLQFLFTVWKEVDEEDGKDRALEDVGCMLISGPLTLREL